MFNTEIGSESMRANIGDVAARCDDVLSANRSFGNPDDHIGGFDQLRHIAFFESNFAWARIHQCFHRGSSENLNLRVDMRDLRAFDAYAGHQALLIEDEGIGVIFQGRG